MTAYFRSFLRIHIYNMSTNTHSLKGDLHKAEFYVWGAITNWEISPPRIIASVSVLSLRFEIRATASRRQALFIYL